MTWRAILIGLLLGLTISAFTYFNDHVARQTSLIGHFLPVSVFGVAALLLLVGNPILFRLRTTWALRGSELAVITAISLAACSIPGHNFARYFVTVTAIPARQYSVNTSWQSHRLMSYLPGGSHLLAQGQVLDWPILVHRVHQNTSADNPLGRLYSLADSSSRTAWDIAFSAPSLSSSQTESLLTSINNILTNPQFSDYPPPPGTPLESLIQHNRQLLDQALGDILLPPPPGHAALVVGGKPHPQITDILGTGLKTGHVLPLDRVPWSLWWPTIRLWGGVVLCLSLVALCLAFIVHRQWSDNELLQYPLASFVEILGRRDSHRSIPHIATSRLFWCGLLALLFIHGVNGLHAWFPNSPQIPLYFNFWGINQLFPAAGRTPNPGSVYAPTIFLSIVAFAFTLNRSVSFTLGICPIFFMIVATLFVINGVPVFYDKFTPNNMNLLRFGAYLGAIVTLLYTGRTYYSQIVVRALGIRRFDHLPDSAVWAARAIAPLLIITIALLMTSGMSLLIACVLVLVCVMIWVVSARIIAETGMVLISGPFLPLGVLPALMGYQALGPTQILLLGIGGFLLIGDPRECLMPYAINGLRMSERTGTAIRKIAPWMLTILIVGGLVAGIIAIGLQYEYGVNFSDGYATNTAPASAFNEASRAVSQLAAQGTLAKSFAMNDSHRLASLMPEPWALGWLAAGLGLVLLTMAARVRWHWWPIHPILFMVIGTWAIGTLWFSFLLGFFAKSIAMYTGGARAYQTTLPLMIGIIAGELLAGLFWQIVGISYYFHTGLAPVSYSIFP